MNSFFSTGPTPWDIAAKGPRRPVRAPVRTLSTTIEDALIGTFSRAQLDSLPPEELNLTWARDDIAPRDDTVKRDAIRGYTHGWTLPQLAGLARRLTTEFELKSSWAVELERQDSRRGRARHCQCAGHAERGTGQGDQQRAHPVAEHVVVPHARAPDSTRSTRARAVSSSTAPSVTALTWSGLTIACHTSRGSRSGRRSPAACAASMSGVARA